MSDRPIEDRLCGRLTDVIFEYLTEKLHSGNFDLSIDGLKPELLFSRDPDVYPLFVDIGDQRLMIEVDVTVWPVEKGSALDITCSEEEVYGGEFA